MIIRYCDYYQPTRNDPAFYTWNNAEWVATLILNGRLLEAWVVGKMRINMPNGDILRYADDLINSGIDSDEKLYNLTKDDDAFDIWENNSWIELRDYDGEWIGDVFSGHVYHDINEAIEGMKACLQDPEFLAEYPCKNPESVVE